MMEYIYKEKHMKYGFPKLNNIYMNNGANGSFVFVECLIWSDFKHYILKQYTLIPRMNLKNI